MTNWYHNSAAWKHLRAAKLSVQPLCEVCIRREVVEPAKVVDHIIPVSAGGEKFPPLSGLMSMCQACHNHKTNAERSGKRSKYKGCDINGDPLMGDDGWEPGAFAGRAIEANRPARETRRYLVSCEDGDLWV
ncbi:hypothetical protein M728_000783 [Ensifer sp. WSM1721]|uniref:HNH endonuclease signature motif containing protein n=1 Tax=Ensifer sp. WSM1721 TaxID=1041159 RepID=UPI00068907A0|nr:HNH endonuclease signature motif containing protein [Ensifer sp. WSM1721]